MDQVKEYYEKLLNLLDWGRASSFFGPVSFASCVIFGFVSLFYGSASFLISLYSLLAGVLIGLWEFPSMYQICHGKEAGPLGTIDMDAIKAKFLEDYNMKRSKNRSILYAGLSLYPLCSDSGLVLYSAVVLLANSVCLLLSHLADSRFEGTNAYSEVNQSADEAATQFDNSAFGAR